jgi:DNA replication ATP-dependent helicase Dna2
LHLVQGPPGTGKTRLLAEILAECAARDERVAVVAYTHRAVDQVLLRAAARMPGVPVVKLDSSRGENRELAERGVRRLTSPERVPADKAPLVVGMTTHAACRASGRVKFDRVAFDEAGQIPMPHAIGSMRLAERWLFVGDHAQLPPVVAGEHHDEHKVSIFEHLSSRYPSTVLETTYRMNEGICAFPSKEFYGGCVRPSDAAAGRRIGLRPGGRFAAALDPSSPAVLVEVPHRGAAMRSRREAVLTAEILLELLHHHGLPASETAAVAPFRAQGMAIREEFERRAAARGLRGRVELPLVETVERIQGRERDVVILSLTSSDPDWLLTQSEFYYMPNRLNVALTRARVKCIVIASPAVFEARPKSLADVKSIQRFRRLRDALPRVDGEALEREIQG